MTNGQSNLTKSVTIDSPARISASKKFMSPGIPGGIRLNAIQNDPTENAFIREDNRLAGFGPGMAATLIGNPGRRGNSLMFTEAKNTRTALGTYGWGIKNTKLDTNIRRKILPDMPHKKAFDFNGLKYLPQMDFTGKFALQLDQELGLPYDMLEDLSVREQRVIIKSRISELR